MSNLSLLQICKNAQMRAGLPILDLIVTNTLNPQAMSFYGLANQEIKDLAIIFDWEELSEEHTFVTVATEEQTDGLPDNLLRIKSETFWNRADQRPVKGPITPVEWQRLKATTTSPINDFYTIRGGKLIIQPVPDAGETWAYEYIKEHTVVDTLGVEKKSFTNDTDVPLLDDELITRGILWRYRNSKGQSYMQEFRDWQAYLVELMARQKGGVDNITLIEPSSLFGISIPESNWNV